MLISSECVVKTVSPTVNYNRQREPSTLHNVDKYSAVVRTHFFQPIIVESLGPINIAEYSFLTEQGRKISGDDRDSSCLCQRISVLMQRYNTILLHERFREENRSDQWTLQWLYSSIINFFFHLEHLQSIKTNNTIDNAYSRIITARPLQQFTWFIIWMHPQHQAATNHQTKPTDLGCESGCYQLQCE